MPVKAQTPTRRVHAMFGGFYCNSFLPSRNTLMSFIQEQEKSYMALSLSITYCRLPWMIRFHETHIMPNPMHICLFSAIGIMLRSKRIPHRLEQIHHIIPSTADVSSSNEDLRYRCVISIEPCPSRSRMDSSEVPLRSSRLAKV